MKQTITPIGRFVHVGYRGGKVLLRAVWGQS